MGESRAETTWFISFIFANAAQAAISPLTPLFILNLKGTIVDVGFVSAAYNLMVIPASVFWGRLSDKMGRRKIFILIGMLSSAILVAAFSLIQNVLQLLLLNALLGFFLTAYVPVASMLIVDMYPKSRWTRFVAIYNFFNLIGWISGIFIGALWFSLFHFGMRELFVFSSILFTSGLVASTLLISDPKGLKKKRETVTPQDKKPLLQALESALREVYTREFTVFLVFITIIFTAYNACFVTLPVYYKSLGISEGNIFLLFLIGPVSAMASNLVAGRLVTGLGEKKVMIGGAIIRGGGAIIFALIGVLVGAVTLKTIAFGVNMILWGSSWSILWIPASIIVLKMGEGPRLGTFQGVFNAFTGIATVIGSFIGGIIPYFYGFPQHFIISGSIALIGVLFLIVGARGHKY